MPASQTKDYYKILGVDRTADQKAIKAAFRKLARKYHPDVNKGDHSAEERFKELNEAFNVVSEPASRKLYDRYGADWERYREAGFTGDEPAGSTNGRGAAGFDSFFGTDGGRGRSTYRFDTSDIGGGSPDFMQSLFGDLRGGSRRTARGSIRSRGEDLEVAVDVTFDEAFNGTTRRIDIQTPETCATCGGSGLARGAICPTCAGSGTTTRSKTIEVKIPAGVATGSKVRIAGQGGPGVNGGKNGDVSINVTVKPDARFERSGDDLKTEFEAPLYTAVLGGEAVVKTPTGQVALSIPAGAQNGRAFRLRGQGMPKLKGASGERGDLLARLKVHVPEHLTPREIELFRELREIRASEPQKS
jgi:DnaJ-class molecular chaperone